VDLCTEKASVKERGIILGKEIHLPKRFYDGNMQSIQGIRDPEKGIRIDVFHH